MALRAKGYCGQVDWFTPPRYLDAVRAVLGTIDLDPASSELAQQYVQATRYFTQDGLDQPWEGGVFVNPPYGSPFIGPFTAKMIESWQDGTMREGILLTNSSTDARWYQATLRACVIACLVQGRIAFLEVAKGQLVPRRSTPLGQTFFYFGRRPVRFAKVFGEFGTTVRVA
jgi:hypothetical protein